MVAGLQDLLDRAAAHGMAVALATSAPALNVTHTLGEIGLAHAFPIVVRGDQVARGKPAPDVFIEASRQLGVAAADCLVFEDAPLGVAAAHGANMRCVALTTTFSAEHFRALPHPPALACRDFAAFLALAGW